MRLITSIALFFILSCKSIHYEADELKLGRPIPASAKLTDTSTFSNMVLFKPNEFKPSQIITFNGIVYNVCLDSSNNIIFIFTNDKNFISSDGYKIGDAYLDLNKSLVLSKYAIPGYGVEILFPSDWKAAFLDQSTLQKGELNDTSKIKCFYKRSE